MVFEAIHLVYKGTEVYQEDLKSGSKSELLKTCFEKEQKIKISLKDKMTDQKLKACNKNLKNAENKKAPKQSRKTDYPVCCTPTIQESTTWTCKNAECRAVVSIDDPFCRRCSCCICHRFDDNKDPTLWLVCESESSPGDSCGSSCHVECALDKEKLGVVRLGQYMGMDGNYCCAVCGQVSEILGCWKKQLAIAKDARCVEVLCYRIFLSYRLFNGTLRFKELQATVTEAKIKLEAELGPMNAESVKMARGLVSRLPIAYAVQKFCSNAIDKAEELLAKIPCVTPNCTVASPPAACRFLFEDVTSSSLVIVLIDIPIPLTDSIKGYKLWFCKSTEETFSKDPFSIFPRNKRQITVKSLQPCTEYTFRIMSYTQTGDLGFSEAKCFTKKVDIFSKSPPSVGCKMELNLEEFCSTDTEQCCGLKNVTRCETLKVDPPPPVIRELDLNVVLVPDLNEDLNPPFESSRDEDNGLSYESRVGAPTRKRGSIAIEDTRDYDSTLLNGSELLDENFEYCVKVIRWLECERYIQQEFRLKLLTWYSLNSTEQERRVMNTFIRTLMDDPKSLAGQLVDSFGDMVSCKRPRNSFTSKLMAIS